jgi:hypothetical protein
MEKNRKLTDRQIEIYRHPNPEIRSFLTNTEISSYRVEKFRKPLEKDWESTLKQLGVIGAQVAKEILAIHDVHEIHIKPKEIRVKKKGSSSWEAIETKIVEILIRALRRKQIKLVKRQG